MISRATSDSLPIRIVAGVEVHRLSAPFRSYRWARLPLVGRHVRFVQDLVYAWQIRRKLNTLALSFKPDIVEYADIDAEGFFHPPSVPFVVKLHTPHIVLRSYYTAREVRYERRSIEWMEARTVCRANGVSSPSHWLADKIAELYQLNRSQIKSVPNMIDTDFFSPFSQSMLGADLMVLYVGRLENLKGSAVFAEAIPEISDALPETSFVFLGADRPTPSGKSQKAVLEAFFVEHALGNRVQFFGHAEPEVFRDFYRRTAVFVMPSLFENSPYTLLEAMACGNPVVVSRAGGMPEMVEDGVSGILFEAGNAHELAEATIRLLKTPSIRIAMGKAAREAVLQRYSLGVGAEATEQFYKQVLERAQPVV